MHPVKPAHTYSAPDFQPSECTEQAVQLGGTFISVDKESLDVNVIEVRSLV